MDKKIVEKYFSNTATPEETRRVLEWFETREGKQYLAEKLQGDSALMEEQNLRKAVPELDSEKLYASVRRRIRRGNLHRFRRRKVLEPLFKAAAAVLVIATASLFFYSTYDSTPEETVRREPVHFQTTGDQQKEITLRDGTVVRLNNNSGIVIDENFLEDNREVTLTGEAYFDVEHNPEKPFIIHANRSSVRVLGTAFNVKSNTDAENVQVAVVEGRVSFASTESSLNEHSVVLKKGQFGYLNVASRSITVDDIAVENYLAWKEGRLAFENLALSEVCTQLNRLYDVECSYAEESIRDLRLTADFSSKSLGKTLSVIGLSLKLDVEQEGEVVYWDYEDSEN